MGQRTTVVQNVACHVPHISHHAASTHECSRADDAAQANQSVVSITNVTYGTSGPFAISIWAKITGSFGGNVFQYIFSHASTNAQTWGGSQVRLEAAQHAWHVQHQPDKLQARPSAGNFHPKQMCK